MADPEEIYKEVLAEEQAKGSAAPVAEGRAKAARQRAVEGSPHPKEAKWWPGSQPQFEGGEAAAPAEETAEEEAPVEEEAVEEAPAAEVETEAAPPPAETVAAPQEVTQDQPAAPAEPAAPAAATAPQPAAAVAAPAAATGPSTLPAGVTHGTPAGNRLRPEDAVSTDVQFDAQKALHQRRKMIDELVATGVPAVSVTGSERRGSGAGMLLLYLLIPLLAIGFLISNKDDLAGASGGGGEHAPEEGGDGGGGLEITAANVAFDTNALTIPADGADLVFHNEDTAEHNVAIYEDDSAEADIFVGDTIPGGQEITYSIPAHEPGEYYFQCDLHPTMNGTATFE